MSKATTTIKYGLTAAACACLCASLVWRDQLVNLRVRSSNEPSQEVEGWIESTVEDGDWEKKLPIVMMNISGSCRTSVSQSSREIGFDSLSSQCSARVI
jgi:hypothetical protein